jgi:hypothetical protein
VIFGDRELNVGVGEEDVGWNDLEVGNRRRVDGQGFALEDRGVDCLLFGDLDIVIEQNFGGVGLGVDIDEEHFLASPGEPGCQGNTCGCLASAAFLACDRDRGHVVKPAATLVNRLLERCFSLIFLE